MYAYHITTYDMVRSILKYGLIPKIGKRSKKLETSKAIHLFKSKNDVEDALMNWLGDEFDEDTRLVLLKIQIPNNVVVYYDGLALNVFSPIKAKYIRVINDNV